MKRSAIRELTFRLIYSLEIQRTDDLEEWQKYQPKPIKIKLSDGSYVVGEPEVSKENLEYEALPTKNEDEEAGQDAETEE